MAYGGQVLPPRRSCIDGFDDVHALVYVTEPEPGRRLSIFTAGAHLLTWVSRHFDNLQKRVGYSPVPQVEHLSTPSILTPTNSFVCIITQVRSDAYLDKHSVNADLRFSPMSHSLKRESHHCDTVCCIHHQASGYLGLSLSLSAIYTGWMIGRQHAPIYRHRCKRST